MTDRGDAPLAARRPDARRPGSSDSSTGRGADERTVMDAEEMSRAITRMAHQVLEANRGATDLLVLGIPTRGVPLAERLAAVMSQVEQHPVPVGTLDITMYRDDLRSQPTRVVGHTQLPAPIDQAVVVLVDDVLYSGRTIRAALDAIGDLGRPRAVRLAVLVDRGHRELPIRADHVGKNLPTAAGERVGVRLTELDGRDAVVISRAVDSSTEDARHRDDQPGGQA